MKVLAPTARPMIRPMRGQGSRFALFILFTLALTISTPILRAQGSGVRVETFALRSGGQVNVENMRGATRVVVWDDQSVRIVAEKKVPANSPLSPSDLVLMSAGDTVFLQSRQTGQQGRIDFMVYVPRRSHLKINGGGWPVEVSGSLASAIVETTSGSIAYELPKFDDARVSMRSARGVVRSNVAMAVSGRAGLRSFQGQLGSGSAPIVLNSQNGNITLSPGPNSSPIATNMQQPNGADAATDLGIETRPAANRAGGASPGGQAEPNVLDTYRQSSPGGPLSRRSSGSNSSGGGPAVFAGSSQNEDEYTSERGGPFTRPRRETRTSNNTAGLSVRIIPADTPLGSSRVPDNPIYDDPTGDDDAQSGTMPKRGGVTQQRSNGTQPSDTSRPPRSGDDPRGDLYDPWGGASRPDDEDEPPRDMISSSNRTDAPPVLRRGGDDGAIKPSSSPERVAVANGGDEEAIVLEASLVNLNVSVTNRSGLALSDLKKEDFELIENGERQTVDFFAASNSPFNLVLVLDLSGSIIDKLDVVKSAALRFLEVIGPEDKVAVVTFTHDVRVISQLTNDRDTLRKRIKAIDNPRGGTSFYEAMWLTLADVLRGTQGQRNAVVVMTDGVDSSLDRFNPAHTRVSFAQLARRLEESDVIVFPVYLDTEYEEVFERGNSTAEVYSIARYQLEKVAELTGGQMFQARQVKDLSGVYKEVAAALRTVYSVGYYPTNSKRDGTFRRVRVNVSRPDAVVRTRKGYYAK